MQDPLTPEQIKEFLFDFGLEWKKVYSELLASGCMGYDAPPQLSANIALILTADKHTPISDVGKQALRNARHFV